MGSDKESIIDDYRSSLEDLTFNSKPLINVLTMLAEENSQYAEDIVKVVVQQIEKAPPQSKMPVLYLMDSILKNVGGEYCNVISHFIVEAFVNVFKKGDEKVRLSLFKLRNTWSACFKANLLHLLDVAVHEIDPNWPIIPLAKNKVNQPSSGDNKNTDNSNHQRMGNKEQRNDSAELLRQKLLQEKVEKATKLREQKLLEEKEKVEQLLAAQERRKLAQQAEEERMRLEVEQQIAQQKRERLIENQRREIEELRNARNELLRANAQQQMNVPKVTSDRSINNKFQPNEMDRSTNYDNDNNNQEGLRGDRNAPGPSFSRNRGNANARGRRAQKRRRRNSNENFPDQSKFTRGGSSRMNRGRMPNRPSGRTDQMERQDRGNRRRLSTQERRQMIPSDNEMPRSMRMDQHSELMTQLERRLSSGQLTKRQHSELSSQLEMLYDIQQKRNVSRDSRNERQWRDQRTREPPMDEPRRSPWYDNGQQQQHRQQSRDSNWTREQSQQHQRLPPNQSQYERSYPTNTERNASSSDSNQGWHEASTAQDNSHWNRNEQVAHQNNQTNPFPPDENSRDPTDNVLREKPDEGGGTSNDGSTESSGFVGVADLFNRLLQSGIISLPSSTNEGDIQQIDSPASNVVTTQTELPDIEWSTASLKSSSYPNIIDQLCQGIQCSSCGLRFAEQLKNEYNDHLDWHFRINRRETDNRRATSRQWFLLASDWLNSDSLTMNASEEAGSSNFLLQPEDASENNENDGHQATCAVNFDIVDDDICDVCLEPFEQYWDEPQEEWRYREAIRAPDGRTYHDQCFKDSAADTTLEDQREDTASDKYGKMITDHVTSDIVNSTNQNESLNVVKTEPDESVII